MEKPVKPVVSFDDEPLILVDKDDKILGYESKLNCHSGDGLLHRAFSVFIFNADSEILLQKRSNQKPLWPGYWANSCCSHPRKGEEQHQAVNRRLWEELGVRTRPEYVFQFQYHAQFGTAGSEHELCSVYIGHHDGPIDVNPNEVSDWCFVSPDELDKAIELQAECYSPWLRMEWPRLRRDHWAQIESMITSSAHQPPNSGR